MKVIITGGTGFLGSRVVRQIKALSGCEPYSITRKENVDILDYQSLSRKFQEIRADTLVHCAALAGGIAINYERPVEMFEQNTLMGLNVIKAGYESRIRKVINVMPNCVYPGNLEAYEESKFWDGPIHESVTTVGIPKKVVWGLCFAYCRKDPDFKPVHLIFPNMYGPEDHFDPVRGHALGSLISKITGAKAENKKTVEIWGTGTPIREWLYVEDGAEAVRRTFQNLDRFEPNEIVNIGIGKGISVRDMAFLIKDIVGWDGDFTFRTDRPDGAMKKIIIADKMRKKLDWEPPTRLEDGIRKTVEWFEKTKRKAALELFR